MTTAWSNSVHPASCNMAAPSGQLAVAVFELLAAAARARVVTADLGHVVAYRLLGRRLGRLLRRRVGVAQRLVVVGMGVLDVLHVRLAGFGLGRLLDLLGRLDTHRQQYPDDIVADTVEHVRKQLERLALVFLLGVLLRIAAQVYALAQVVQGRQVFAP